ncbi:MAG: methyltransferase domain-containing protein [Sphingobacteriales bacterium]|nr:MAG: methyltransferase domain-containing protein [Sphingobacteriales bacterium]
MQALFVAIYNFLHRNKMLCWLLFTVSLAFWIFCACQIKFKEDISSMLPDSKAIKAMNDVVSHTQAGEQVLFTLSLTDTTATDADSLVAAANDLQTQLLAKEGKYIDTIILQPGGGIEESLFDLFKNKLPLFLTKGDYTKLDTLLQPAHITTTLENNRRILMSPAGVMYKQLVAQDPVGISALAWSKLKTLQLDSSYQTYDGYLFTGQLKQLTFFLKPLHKASETGENAKFFKQVDELIAQWQQKNKGVHVAYFGGPAVAAGNASQMRTDTIVTLSVTVVLLLALTWYFFRRKRTPLLLLIPVLYGAAMGLGVIYLVQGSLSVIALGAGAIILGIAIDFSIHFLSHRRHTHTMQEAIADLAQPLTIGSFTTIAAFYSLRWAHTPILQDLGLFAAVSLLGAALCTLIFLPHFPLGGHKETKPTIFDKVALWQPERNKWLVLAIFLLTPVMYHFGKNVQFDSDLMHLNYLSPDLQKAQDEVSKANAFSLSSVFLVAHADDENKALQNLEAVQLRIQSLVEKGWVRGVSNPIILLPSKAEQQERINRWNSFWTTERKQLVVASVNASAYQTGFNADAFTGFTQTLNTSYEPFSTNETALLKALYPGSFTTDANDQYAIASLRVEPQYRKRVFDALSKQEYVTVTDRQQGATQLVDILNKDFTNIAIYSSLIVFFALLIGYGRIELAIISFLPMIISWIWILGLMSLLGLKFNIVNIIISSLIFGLGDDYAIFTMDGLIEKYKYGNRKLESVRAAVYVSVVTVIIGLGVLLLAKHPALRSIAFISVTGLVCVLVISQTVQPMLFNWFIQRRADKKLLPFTLWSFAKSVFAFAYFFTGSMVLTILGLILTRLWPFPNKNKAKYWFHTWVSRYTWSMMYIMGNLKKSVHNPSGEDFQTPAVYIANHASFLDILVTTMLHPKLVLMTNRWVWRSPVFGAVVRMAEYYPVADGAEDSLEPLQDLVNRGYSIMVFPEGTRSYDDTIKRFHKGAFFIAEKLKLDIVPVILHGIQYNMQKGDWLLKDGHASVYIYPRIKLSDKEFGAGYSERAKLIGRWMRSEYAQIKANNEQPVYFKEQLLRSYTYKGPVLEWYCRIKTKLENYYQPFHELLPSEGKFYDLGCGYGFMSYMLHWAAPKREFIGIDYDEEKIETAQHNFLKDDTINFQQGDLSTTNLEPCDGIIIADVLHYLMPESQNELIEKSIAALNPGGTIIIRDGVAELQQRIKGTKLTELFSTRIFKFNKTANKLSYISQANIESIAAKHGLQLQILDNSKLTANLVFVLKKP